MKSILFSVTLLLGLITSLNAQDFHLPVSTKSETAKRAYQAASYLGSNIRFDAARVEIKKAIAADPDFFMAYVYDYQVLAGDEQKPAVLDKALAIDPSNFTEAEKIMRRQLQAWKADPKAKTTEAMADLTTAYPNTPEAFEWAYLHALFTDGNKQAALQYAKKLIVLTPDFAPVYNGVGYLYMGEKKMAEAKAAFEKYLELAPAEANAYDSMGEYYLNVGNYAKSAEYYDRAVALGMEDSKKGAEKARTAMIVSTTSEKPEYFLLRPEVEKAYGYSHAVKIGNSIKISGAVSMDDEGNPTAKGDLLQQMKNCYADLEKVLKHYGCTFDDVVVENVFTTNMPLFLENAAYRSEIYKNHFPTGSWLGVKELALPEFMIEIELEVHKSN